MAGADETLVLGGVQADVVTAVGAPNTQAVDMRCTTTVLQSVQDMMSATVDSLRGQMQGKAGPRNAVVPYQLMERQSVCVSTSKVAR